MFLRLRKKTYDWATIRALSFSENRRRLSTPISNSTRPSLKSSRGKVPRSFSPS